MAVIARPRSDAAAGTIGALERGPRGLLLSGTWGFEREALRVDAEGRISTADHPFPPDRGDITVDFAESQLELVTRPRPGLEEALGELRDLHGATYEGIGGELVWPLSVPGRWDEPGRLRPARFAGSPEREDARLYRESLLERYGAARQAISGFHYNYSPSRELWEYLAEAEGSGEDERRFTDRRYLDMARNFARYSFLPAFLFSASPAIDPRFVEDLARSAGGGARRLVSACSGRTASLRLGPLGYRLSEATARKVDVRMESLEDYVRALGEALAPRDGSPPPLRSESEFYAPVRPKASASGGTGSKSSLASLEARGVEYLEFRVFDLDPFEPCGMGEDAARLVHLFALACLASPSPPLGRSVAAADPLSEAASSCSLGYARRGPDRRIASAVRRAAAAPLAAMSRIARLLPPEYGRALSRYSLVLEARAPRSAERFADLARDRGGGLAAGLELARAHRESIMGARRAASWNT
jgi:glutamate--cysteine ligase